MRKLIVSLVATAALFTGAGAAVATTVEEDGSGRVAGVTYCLPTAQCQD